MSQGNMTAIGLLYIEENPIIGFLTLGIIAIIICYIIIRLGLIPREDLVK